MTTRLRILHLEDEPRDAELAQAMLEADGLLCDVVPVSDRDAFVRALESGGFDVILADFSIPGFDGITAQQLAHDRRPDVPFIFVSGTLGEEVAIERLKAGATDYVLKQRLSRLSTAIRRALREADERRERLRAEQEIRRLNADLERRVVERTAELEATNEALKRREAELQEAQAILEQTSGAKSQFLSRMSHDLRTPLNAILGFAQLLAMDALSPDQQDNVKQILKAGEYLLVLIEEVLDIARIESGYLSLSPEAVAVAEVVAEVLDLSRPLAAQRNIVLIADPSSSCEHSVSADRQRLRQILLNLISNAVKYNRDGGQVTISCETNPEDRLRIKVADTGTGIPPQKLALLFTPFERLGAEHSSIEGTGLGLALSRGLAAAMGGTVDVESIVDQGSTFWVELVMAERPDVQEGAAGPAKLAKPANVPAVAGSVLYIEDNLPNVRLIERLLSRQRPRITLLGATSGSDGIRLARERAPELILLDLHLPDISGEEVLRMLWEDTRTRQIPVAILSADATPSQVKRLLASGASAYLTKPLDIDRLLRLIDTQLNRQSSAERQAR